MKQKQMITLLFLIGSIISCTNQKKEIVSEQATISDTVAVTPEITAPVYGYTEDERNGPVDSCTHPIDINGLDINKSYSLEALTEAFGDPARSEKWETYWKYAWEDYGRWNAYFPYNGHNSGFEYSKENGFEEFVFYDPRFSIYNGLISVGKHVSLFKSIGCGGLGGRLGVYSNVEKGSYRFCTTNDPTKNVFLIETDKKGIITSIIFYRHEDSGATEGEEP